MYVYMRTEFAPYELYTVGFYDTAGKWHSESDHAVKEDAANRAAFLNGGTKQNTLMDKSIIKWRIFYAAVFIIAVLVIIYSVSKL